MKAGRPKFSCCRLVDLEASLVSRAEEEKRAGGPASMAFYVSLFPHSFTIPHLFSP